MGRSLLKVRVGRAFHPPWSARRAGESSGPDDHRSLATLRSKTRAARAHQLGAGFELAVVSRCRTHRYLQGKARNLLSLAHQIGASLNDGINCEKYKQTKEQQQLLSHSVNLS
jgi:hypothetical protein